MVSVRRLASELRRRTLTTMFGNNHSLALNLRYAAYHKRARACWTPRWTPLEESRKTATGFAAQGFKILPPPAAMDAGALAAIQQKVDALFVAQKGGYAVGSGMSRLIDGLELVPEITDFIDAELEQVLELYFQSFFKIYAVSLYRTLPTPDRPQSSFLWHQDNCPRQEIKLMIYLDDVAADTGAFRIKSRPMSETLRERGFLDRTKVAALQGELDDASATTVIEAGVGTRILFENSRCIHRAISPLRAHRDVVTMVLIPSDIHWRPHFARHRNLLSTNAGICLDPFTDAPENIGYEY